MEMNNLRLFKIYECNFNQVFVYIAWQIKYVSRGFVLLTKLASPFFFFFLPQKQLLKRLLITFPYN